jgi:rare lipoprotein A
LSWGACNAYLSGIVCFYWHICKWDETQFQSPPRPRVKKLPIVFSRQEVKRLPAAVHGSTRFCHAAYVLRLCETGDHRLEITNQKGNKLLRISKGFLCVLTYFTVLGISSSPAQGDSKWLGYTESGKASFYALKFQSKKTASGELYDKAKKTAAHKKLPFGTKVKVTNTKNSKSVIVKINDRGPFVKSRMIDLSGSAFRSIANFDAGVIDVKIKVIK